MANILLITAFCFNLLRFGNGMSIYNGIMSAAVIKVTAQYPCDEPAILNLKVDLRPGDTFDMAWEFESQTDINTYKVLLQIDKFAGNKWNENFLFTQGQVCDLLNKYAKKIWERLRLATTPQIMNNCVIPKGKYVAKNSFISPTDLNVPVVFYGLWKVISRVYNKDGELLICQVTEVETQRNL